MLPAYSGGTAWAFHPLRVAVGPISRPAVLARHRQHDTKKVLRIPTFLWSLVGGRRDDRVFRVFGVLRRLNRAFRTAAGLADIARKLDAGERLSFDDGVRLFECPDMLALGWLANRERERRHGARTYYNFNIRLEATNVCVASCLFCSFARLQARRSGLVHDVARAGWDKLRQRAGQPLTEVHVVNGLHPDLPFSYYTELLRGFKRIRPDIHLKCFTAVEIAFFADLYGMTDEQVLRELQDAGLDSLPGGGAEIFAERVRQKICARQVRRRSVSRDPSARAPAGHAHQHHDALRPHRDGRGARRSHAARRARCRTRPAASRRSSRSRSIPTTTRCGSCRRRARSRRCACTPSSRLMLDNVPHIKAFWIATGVETAQLALWFGADDLDGTVQEERIYHMAGSRTPEAMTTTAIRRLIRAAGREPVERDTLYNVDHRPGSRCGRCCVSRDVARAVRESASAGELVPRCQ